MPRILVTKPFGARFQSGKPRRQFPVGEHLLTQEELDYWFVQRKIDSGCATVLPDLGEESKPSEDDLASQVSQNDQVDLAQPANALEDEFLQAMNCPVGAAFPVTTEFVGQKPAPAPAAKPVKAPAAKPDKAPAAKPKAKPGSKPAAKPKGKGK